MANDEEVIETLENELSKLDEERVEIQENLDEINEKIKALEYSINLAYKESYFNQDKIIIKLSGNGEESDLEAGSYDLSQEEYEKYSEKYCRNYDELVPKLFFIRKIVYKIDGDDTLKEAYENIPIYNIPRKNVAIYSPIYDIELENGIKICLSQIITFNTNRKNMSISFKWSSENKNIELKEVHLSINSSKIDYLLKGEL